ncbi:uncharacterized protein LOC131939416 [Physella acuta]|uniref:uncharacterized protein LOC131939416 n=1 Tax=Physella acuta TaxID=109671 RepID=UPI0027DE8C02|nr:uncharacterized protein LOC131939416 [Physella acuta]
MCYCNHTDSTNTHHIVVNITADRRFSGAHIQGVLASETSFIYSNVQSFPKIYNISEIKLTVNELNLPFLINKPVVDTNVSELKACCRDSPLPCRTKIVSNDVVVASGVPCVAYNFSNHDNGTAQLIVDVCDVMEYTIPVRFLQDSDLLTSFMKMDTLLIKVTTPAAAVIVTILFVVCAISYVKGNFNFYNFGNVVIRVDNLHL